MKGKITQVEKLFLTNKEAQAYLGVSPDFLKDLRSNARISYSKVGKMIWYEKKDLDNLVRKAKVI